MSDLREAIAVLQRARAAAMSVVQKYDTALKTLMELDHDIDATTVTPPPPEAARSPEVDFPVVPSALVEARGTRVPVSVLSKVRDLLSEAPRAWTTKGIIAEYQNRLNPIVAANPGNAIRTALGTLVKADEVVRVSEGTYLARKYKHILDNGTGAILVDQSGSGSTTSTSSTDGPVRPVVPIRLASMGVS